MPGPLPQPHRRRRNAPTIPTTTLRASGRPGPAPRVPAGYRLDKHGRAWWRWAWGLPQALAWADGDLVALARRASLEDDLAVLGRVDATYDLAELLALDPEDVGPALGQVEAIISRLKALSGGKLALCREMRELDDRFGLTPKSLAQLRWSIVPDETAGNGPADDVEDDVARRRREREARRVTATG